MSVFSIRDQVNTAFVSGTFGCDAVLGARGSKLQLVLNAVYHLETSPGNLSWDMYEAISDNPAIKEAVPDMLWGTITLGIGLLEPLRNYLKIAKIAKVMSYR